jgi:hypothetical protein
MLTLETQKENFKRYNNGKGYKITVGISDIKQKSYRVFKEESAYIKYLPDIIIEDIDGIGKYEFKIINHVHISTDDATEAIYLLEQYLQAYKIAKESIEEFKMAIENDEI